VTSLPKYFLLPFVFHCLCAKQCVPWKKFKGNLIYYSSTGERLVSIIADTSIVIFKVFPLSNSDL
jgi:hypothetical protein